MVGPIPLSHWWTITDGHAGNVRQASALAAALAGADAPPMRDWRLSTRPPWRWLAPRGVAGAGRAFDAGFPAALRLAPPSLAIGCGRQAALATRLARRHGARTVQILDPRIDPRHWDLVVAPRHDRLRGGNVVSLLGSLHPVDDGWLAAGRNAHPGMATLPGPRTALLLGGPGPHANFDHDDFATLAGLLQASLDASGGSLLATVSRRTPQAIAAELRRRFGGYPGLIWLGTEDGPNPYAGLLAWADRIVCTADSVNMLSESCATHAPVFVAAPGRVHGGPRRFVDALFARGRVRRLDDGLAPFAVQPLRETARVAAIVRERLGL